MTDASRIDRIESKLREAFLPTELEIVDESDLHIGHAGARDGKGHFRVRIVAEKFKGKAAMDRHRMIYSALDDMMTTDIHALSIQVSTPED